MLQQNDINNIKFPLINIRRTSNLAVAPINTFCLAIAIFMFAAPLMKWCEFRSTTMAVSFACGGICLYIIGIYNWYQNKTVDCFFDFMFSFLNLLICYYIYFSPVTADDGTSKSPDTEDILKLFGNYMIGTFFVLYLVVLLVLALANLKKGIIYLVFIGFLVLGDIFLIVWIYRFKRKDENNTKRVRKAAGYFLFFASLVLWYTGVGKFINEIFEKNVVPMINYEP